MKKIQSRYVLWSLLVTFSMNVTAPVFATEPKKEKLSFAQRINPIRRTKEWLKETNALRKKVVAGTATKDEKKQFYLRISKVVAGLLLRYGLYRLFKRFIKPKLEEYAQELKEEQPRWEEHERSWREEIREKKAQLQLKEQQREVEAIFSGSKRLEDTALNQEDLKEAIARVLKEYPFYLVKDFVMKLRQKRPELFPEL